MRVEVLKSDRLRLVRTVAVVALTALGAGCSADLARFDDGFYTGAVPNKPMPQASVGAGASQPFPGSVDQTRTGSVNGVVRMPLYDGGQPAENYAASHPQSGVREASVQRSVLAPPSDSPAPVIAEPRAYAPPAAPMPAEEPVRADAAPTKAGWNKTGNMVTLREGETLDTLSNRYGVPVKAIMAANDLTGASQTSPGQRIAIPTYSYGTKAGVKTTASAETPALGTPSQTLKAPSAAKVAAATPGRVMVESGDSLAAIARRSGVSVAELKAANGMTGDTVRIGQKLLLPSGAVEPKRVASLDPKEGVEPRGVVKPAAKAVAETAEKQPKPYQAPQPAKVAEAKPAAPAPAPVSVAAAPVEAAPVKPADPDTTITDESEKETASAAPAGTGIDQFRWPVQGRVLKRFGDKDGSRRNDGLDISVPRGTPVKAAENGVVIYAGDGLKEFGNTVLVRHDNGLVTVYGHADDLKVKRGETVKRGQEIATAGMSGDASSPMLHFEVRKNSAPVDPGKYLQ